jgi:hypothetical protein
VAKVPLIAEVCSYSPPTGQRNAGIARVPKQPLPWLCPPVLGWCAQGFTSRSDNFRFEIKKQEMFTLCACG